MSVTGGCQGSQELLREDINNTVHWTLERWGAIYCNVVQFTFFLTLYFCTFAVKLHCSIARKPAYLYLKLCLYLYLSFVQQQSVECRARRPGQPTDGFWPSQLTAHSSQAGSGASVNIISIIFTFDIVIVVVAVVVVFVVIVVVIVIVNVIVVLRLARGQVSTSSASFSPLLPFAPSSIVTSQFRHRFHPHH